jgi:hypothetical protein
VPHLAILDDLVSEVLPDVDVLGPLASTHDVVSPLDARGVVLKHRRGVLLSQPESLEEVLEVQNVHASCRCRVVFRESPPLPWREPQSTASWSAT